MIILIISAMQQIKILDMNYKILRTCSQREAIKVKKLKTET